jgi:hypothetical protein
VVEAASVRGAGRVVHRKDGGTPQAVIRPPIYLHGNLKPGQLSVRLAFFRQMCRIDDCRGDLAWRGLESRQPNGCWIPTQPNTRDAGVFRVRHVIILNRLTERGNE